VSSDPRQVVIESVSILVPDRPDLVFPLDTKEAVAALAAQSPTFKEGACCTRSMHSPVQAHAGLAAPCAAP
jgi:hypothetical protein